MYLKINKATRKPDQYGHCIEITRIGYYDDNGKWIKWVKLNEFTLTLLLEAKLNIQINDTTTADSSST